MVSRFFGLFAATTQGSVQRWYLADAKMGPSNASMEALRPHQIYALIKVKDEIELINFMCRSLILLICLD
jgi:hypothetical protein